MWAYYAAVISSSRRRALFIATLAIAIAIVAAWALGGAAPLAAQRPGPGGGALEQVFRRYATRLVIPVLDGGNRGSLGNKGDASNVLKLVTVGWKPTSVLIVEIADSPPTLNCVAAIPTTRFGKISCLTLAPFTPLDVKLGLEAGHVLVYSLSPAGIVDACTSFGTVKNGSRTLEAWEQETWNMSPGDSIAATLFASTADAVTSLPARVTGVNIGASTDRGGQFPAAPTRGQALPSVWSGTGTRVDLFNGGVACATVRSRWVAANLEQCAPAPSGETMVPALASADLPVSGDGAVGLTAPIDVVTSVDHFDASGWLSYSGIQSGTADGSGQLAFPLAVADFPNLNSELWVTNQHPTATAQIDILMWDGNGKLKVHKDTLPLCPGGVRMFDVQKIAGTIDPTRIGRGTTEGPPMLALRVESTNRELPAAPPISGLMILRSDWGVTAYPAMSAQPELQQMQQLGRVRGLQPYTIVPNVKINAGSPARSTLLAAQNLTEPATPALSMDFYDQTGRLVVANVDVQVGGQGLVGSAFIDLGRMAGRRDGPPIPATFEGFVVVRGQQAYGLLGVVAVEVPHLAASGPPPAPGKDTFVSWTGITLPRWVNPDAPTVTPGATVVRPTPGAGTGTPMRPTPGVGTGTPMRPTPARMTPTPTATRDEATPTPGRADQPVRLLLPALLNGPLDG